MLAKTLKDAITTSDLVLLLRQSKTLCKIGCSISNFIVSGRSAAKFETPHNVSFIKLSKLAFVRNLAKTSMTPASNNF